MVNHDEFTPFLTRNIHAYTHAAHPRLLQLLREERVQPTHKRAGRQRYTPFFPHSLHFLPDKELDDENNPLTRLFLVLPLGGGRLAKLEEEETP
jgi:hypothetical protein